VAPTDGVVVTEETHGVIAEQDNPP
jgi:hypothetical protein